jgi:hypothetical protein
MDLFSLKRKLSSSSSENEEDNSKKVEVPAAIQEKQTKE